MVVYPRWRGELFCALAFCWLSRGLSPLARGTLCRCQHCWRVIRFIPAGAGNTVPRIISLSSSTVYPRWRGEHSASLMPIIGLGGLSPLARGTLCRCQHCWRVIRFIPAGAGNTVPRIISLSSSTVYPRWRGEHSASLMPIIGLGGLSPLARGTRRQRIVRLPLHRFIPAGAGNTSTLSITTDREPVYPRWRGEHPNGSALSYPQIGLSPLARGTQSDAIDALIDARFIPAGAGNTEGAEEYRIQNAVYPRWRGEHQLSDVSLAWRHGLSPLARGTPVHIRFLVARSRFIPAGAGNTDQIPVPQSTPSVYPRWRGEHLLIKWRARCVYGLSPLARGTPVVRY